MLILSLDSAGGGCSVCVWRDGKTVTLAAETMERGQDRRLMPLILETMTKAGVEFPALDRIAVTRGPGSFTGLRIGLAAARGIGLAANKPVIGIDRFSIYRETNKDAGKNLFVVLESKREELYCRFYPSGNEAHEAQMLTRKEIVAFLAQHENTIVAGDAPVANADYRAPPENEAVTCALLAAQAASGDPQFLPRPLYVRAPDVTFPRAKSA